ncbi:hypothetical protein LOAG_08988 [Loa loa]|uniref:Uncharacterized protein n=1 Tax=Loa loa TaxID=7209 RepID=A0A1S0TT88_LOALO|nr:hypothetical protein LOAG_08988 [Loa loa]EFO19504.1 hypothetical protein LOAG_08988 [Loa loa]
MNTTQTAKSVRQQANDQCHRPQISHTGGSSNGNLLLDFRVELTQRLAARGLDAAFQQVFSIREVAGEACHPHRSSLALNQNFPMLKSVDLYNTSSSPQY